MTEEKTEPTVMPKEEVFDKGPPILQSMIPSMPNWAESIFKIHPSKNVKRVPKQEEVEDFDDDLFDGPDPPMMGSRRENSLYYLTQKFLYRVLESKSVRCDLNEMAIGLGISQKRRLYDITNVLEGIGLIEKTQMGVFIWHGGQAILNPSSSQTAEETDPAILASLAEKREEILKMTEQENELDKQISIVKKNIRELYAASESAKYLYQRPEDILAACPENKSFVVKFVNGTLVTTPPEQWMYTVMLYHAWIRSQSPLEGYFLTTAGDEDTEQEFTSNIPEYYGRLPRNPYEWPEHEESKKVFHSFFPHNDSVNMKPAMKGRPIAIPLSPSSPEYSFSTPGEPSLLDLYGDDNSPF